MMIESEREPMARLFARVSRPISSRLIDPSMETALVPGASRETCFTALLTWPRITFTEPMPTPAATMTRMPRPSVSFAHHGLRCLRPRDFDFVPGGRVPGDLKPDGRVVEGLAAERVDPREEVPRDEPEPLTPD